MGVIGLPDPIAGQSIKAIVELKSDAAPSEALQRAIMAHARKLLGAAIAPREIDFMASLPRTRSGKIMRRLLRARELGLPEGDLSTLEGTRMIAVPAAERHPRARSAAAPRDAAHPLLRGPLRASSTVNEKIRGFLHLYNGEEAVAVGVMQALAPQDAIVSTYREHGHAIARGVSMDAIMAELFGKRTGASRGRGGSMHIFDAATRFYGGNAIVGGGLPLAVGLALAEKLQQRTAIAAVLLRRGRGRRRRVPRIAESRRPVAAARAVRLREQPLRDGHGARPVRIRERHLHEGAQLPGARDAVDGMDVLAVEEAARAAVAPHPRRRGPVFLEAAHISFPGAFDVRRRSSIASKKEVEEWQKTRPADHAHHASQGRAPHDRGRLPAARG